MHRRMTVERKSMLHLCSPFSLFTWKFVRFGAALCLSLPYLIRECLFCWFYEKREIILEYKRVNERKCIWGVFVENLLRHSPVIIVTVKKISFRAFCLSLSPLCVYVCMCVNHRMQYLRAPRILHSDMTSDKCKMHAVTIRTESSTVQLIWLHLHTRTLMCFSCA